MLSQKAPNRRKPAKLGLRVTEKTRRMIDEITEVEDITITALFEELVKNRHARLKRVRNDVDHCPPNGYEPRPQG
jgi:hypothetical protein